MMAVLSGSPRRAGKQAHYPRPPPARPSCPWSISHLTPHLYHLALRPSPPMAGMAGTVTGLHPHPHPRDHGAGEGGRGGRRRKHSNQVRFDDWAYLRVASIMMLLGAPSLSAMHVARSRAHRGPPGSPDGAGGLRGRPRRVRSPAVRLPRGRAQLVGPGADGGAVGGMRGGQGLAQERACRGARRRGDRGVDAHVGVRRRLMMVAGQRCSVRYRLIQAVFGNCARACGRAEGHPVNLKASLTSRILNILRSACAGIGHRSAHGLWSEPACPWGGAAPGEACGASAC